MRIALLVWILLLAGPGEAHEQAALRPDTPAVSAEGGLSPEAVATLFERMGHMSSDDRGIAREQLLEHGEKIVPALIAGLEHDSHHVRRESARTLHEFPEHAEGAVPPLIRLLTDHNEDGDVAGWAQRTLVAIGEPAVPALTEALGHSSHRARYRAAYALGSLREAAIPAMPALIEVLKDDSSDVRHRATSALRVLALHDANPLLEAIDSDSTAVRFGVAQALGSAREHHEVAISVFVELLADENPEWRRAAVFALGERGTPAHLALGELLELLDDPDPEVRRRLPRAVMAAGGTDAEVVERLARRLLEDPDVIVRQRIAGVLSLIGEAAAPARDALLTVVEAEEDPQLRHAAAAALLQIGEGDDVGTIVAVLSELIKQEDAGWAPPALRLLEQIGHDADASLPVIRSAMDHEWADVRRRAVAALAAVESDAEALVEDLVEALEDPDYNVRMHAIGSLGRIEADAPDAIAALRRVQREDPDARVRQYAAEVLEWLQRRMISCANLGKTVATALPKEPGRSRLHSSPLLRLLITDVAKMRDFAHVEAALRPRFFPMPASFLQSLRLLG